MKTILTLLLVLFASPLLAANECAGTPYRNLGRSCADLGLDSNRAVCRPGDRYAVMCDDTREGLVRTCRANVRCDGDPGRKDDWRHDGRDYDHRGHGHYGGDWVREGTWDRGDVFYEGRWRACESLRFDRRGDPAGYCARNRVNRDCRGRCERY